MLDCAGGQKRIDAQHARGKLTARERIDYCLMKGRSEEFDNVGHTRCTDFRDEEQKPAGDGVLSPGWGTINGRPGLCVQSGFHRFRRLAVAEPTRRRFAKFQEHGDPEWCAVIGINDSGGWRGIQEGESTALRYAEVFQRKLSKPRGDPARSA